MEKYIALSLLIIGIYITAQFWVWMYNSMIGITDRKNIIIYSLVSGCLAAGAILLYPKILGILALDEYSFITHDFSLKTLGIFMIYINIFITGLNIILRTFNKKALFVQLLLNLYFAVFFLSVYYFKGIEFGLIAGASVYYMFIAYGEEMSKSQIAFSLNKKKGILPSDILFFHILTGVGFAFWENIVYTVSAIDSKVGFLSIFISGLFLVIIRGLIGFGVHSVYSSFIGFAGIGKGLAIGCLAAFTLHYTYDLLLSMGMKSIIFISIIIGYFWISYMFYQIDRIYITSAIR